MTEPTRGQQAAAFHGLAINRAMPPADRWAAALKALDLYEAALQDAERDRRVAETARLWRSGNGVRNHQERVAQMMALIDAIDASIAGEDF